MSIAGSILYFFIRFALYSAIQGLLTGAYPLFLLPVLLLAADLLTHIIYLGS
jgi:hypothetical protein